MTHVYKLKFCLIGENAAGKTSLVKNFISGAYSKDYRPTIGTNLFIKRLAFKDDQNERYDFTITTWDIAGQERWANMRQTYYRGAHGVFMVADLTRKSSFKAAEDFWIPDFRANRNDKLRTPIILLANKNDLTPEITEDEIREIAKRCGIAKVIFTSAKTSYHVKEAFSSLIKECVKNETLLSIPLKLGD